MHVHLLRFQAEVTGRLRLPCAAGAALRGALFSALRRQFCLASRGPGCGTPAVAASCPVCFLLAPVDERDRRGQDVPRPYVLQVPFNPTSVSYQPGQRLDFSLATFGRALHHFPYALLGVQEMGREGIGAARAGTFRIEEVWAENPLLGRQEAVYARARGAEVRQPALAITHEQVVREAAQLAREGCARRLRLRLLTPVRLIERSVLVKPESFAFRPVVGRLLERLTALWTRYGDGPPSFDAQALLRLADSVAVADRQLQWCDVFRPSGRHQRMLPMGGLVGSVRLEGELEPLLPWLVWGTLVHVGKDATMGNGSLALEPAR